jgi:GNAT superfamily N-acetyltransferase
MAGASTSPKGPDAAAEITFRLAEAADLPALFPVFRTALNSYLEPAGQPLLPDEDDQQPGYRHFLEHDAERFWVAERDGALVAYGNGLLRGDWWFLSNLFVLPDAQGLGIGGRLLQLAGTGAPAQAVRATITDSIQPVSNTLYARRGMLPREVLVGFGGRPRDDLERPRLGRLEPEPLTAASVPELRDIDAAASGVDRTVDHGFYLGAGGRRGWLFRRGGRAVAYAMVRKDGWVGPLAALRTADVEPVTHFVLAELAGEGAVKVKAGVLGSCEGAQRAFWDAGLVFSESAGLLLSSRAFGRLDRYVAAGYGTF